MKNGDLKVWWIPQIPMVAFDVPVESPKEAQKLLGILADYDKFQFEHKVKPDYSNTGGLMVVEDGEWVDWLDEDGNSIDEVEFK